MTALAAQRILVPTDVSDFGIAALQWAGMIHRRTGAEVTLLHASPRYLPFDIIEGPAAWALQARPELRQRLETELREYAAKHLPEIHTNTLVVDDAPAPAILDTAREIDADLIVMATHGRSGWRRVLLGSVTESVVHHSDRQVLCVPPNSVRPAPGTVGRILCPVNFTPVGRQALEQAALIASLFDAELLVVHVVDHTDRDPDVEGGFAAWIEPGVRKRCRYVHAVTRGDPAEETLRMAATTDADLIVLGLQHKFFADATVIGTTTERVIRFARRPVLAVVAPATAPRLAEPVARHTMAATE